MGRFDAKTSVKGQTTIPVEVRRALGLAPGGRVQFVTEETGEVRVIAKSTSLAHLKSIFGPLDRPLDIEEAISETVRRKTMQDESD